MKGVCFETWLVQVCIKSIHSTESLAHLHFSFDFWQCWNMVCERVFTTTKMFWLGSRLGEVPNYGIFLMFHLFSFLLTFICKLSSKFFAMALHCKGNVDPKTLMMMIIVMVYSLIFSCFIKLMKRLNHL